MSIFIGLMTMIVMTITITYHNDDDNDNDDLKVIKLVIKSKSVRIVFCTN